MLHFELFVIAQNKNSLIEQVSLNQHLNTAIVDMHKLNYKII